MVGESACVIRPLSPGKDRGIKIRPARAWTQRSVAWSDGERSTDPGTHAESQALHLHGNSKSSELPSYKSTLNGPIVERQSV